LDIKEYVTDSNIFYMGIPFQSDSSFKYYITPDILGEICHIKKTIDGLNLLLSLKKVMIVDPSSENIRYVSNKIKLLGQFGLSKPDCSIIALSFQLNIPIMSTDFTVINTAKILSLNTLIPGKINFEVKKNKKYCSICKKYFDIKYLYCNCCGNKLIFKILKDAK
jgi:rRNA maturation endonuclease Nob1